MPFALRFMIDNDIVGNFNVAPKWVHSINDLANIGKKACLKDELVVNYDSTKPDGQFRKDVDSSKLLSSLTDFEFTTLEKGIKKVYDKFSQRYNK